MKIQRSEKSRSEENTKLYKLRNIICHAQTKIYYIKIKLKKLFYVYDQLENAIARFFERAFFIHMSYFCLQGKIYHFQL